MGIIITANFLQKKLHKNCHFVVFRAIFWCKRAFFRTFALVKGDKHALF